MTNQSLSWLMIRSMTLVAAAAFAILIVSLTGYSIAWYWLHPDYADVAHLTPIDFVALVIVFSLSIIVAIVVGWKLAQRFIEPMHAMGEAAKSIAKGELGTRVLRAGDSKGSMGEIDDLVDNFNRMAELLELAQSDFRYQNSAIAHELRTPLTILKGRLQGLADGVFAPTPELFTALIGHVDSLTTIVDDLRTLALFTAGQLDLRLERFDLSGELKSILMSHARELERAEIAVKLNLLPIELTADRNRIRQVALALIDNACRYASGSTLTIGAELTEDKAVVTVADDGPGLSEYEVRQVFERFWRADDSRSRSRGGSGLGLSVVKAIVMAHQGDVSVQRNEAGGLTFQIYLPKAAPSATSPL